MKQIFKNTPVFLAIVFIVSIIPTNVFAIGSDLSRYSQMDEQSSKNIEIRAKLCERYGSTSFGSNFDSKENKVKGTLGDREADIESRRSSADEERSNLRVIADQKRQEYYAKILENATTDEQKAAIAVFQESVEAAVTKRRNALDQARLDYRTGVDALIASQRLAYEKAIDLLKSETDTAIQKAKQSCESGVSSTDVSATLKTELKSARDKFTQSVDGKDSIKDQLEVLRNTRKSSYEAAKETFVAELEAAKDALKLALGN